MNIDERVKLLQEETILKEEEKYILDLLRDFCLVNKEVFDITLRLVGGWVRNKLINEDSNDYDITLDGCNINDFSTIFSKYLDEKNISYEEIKNPKQSEHLGCTHFVINNDILLDFSCLRSETYNDSRIPQISIGNLYDDSVRRDFSINALYYNIYQRKVEDLHNGIQDLKDLKLRTPKDVFVSFKEDPLRILRAIRFASRFNLQYDEKMEEASKSNIDNFLKKVSSELIERELSKALCCTNFIRFLEDLNRFGLFKYIFFNIRETFDMNNEEAIERVRKCFTRYNSENKLSVILTSIYYPLFLDVRIVSKKVDVAFKIIAHELRFTKDVAKDVNSLVIGMHFLRNINREIELTRSSVGIAIRNAGEKWEESVPLILEDEIYDWIMMKLIPFIDKENLRRAYEVRPLLKGNELSSILNIKPDKDFESYIEEELKWQFENPDCSADDYKNYLYKHLDDIKVS